MPLLRIVATINKLPGNLVTFGAVNCRLSYIILGLSYRIDVPTKRLICQAQRSSSSHNIIVFYFYTLYCFTRRHKASRLLSGDLGDDANTEANVEGLLRRIEAAEGLADSGCESTPSTRVRA